MVFLFTAFYTPMEIILFGDQYTKGTLYIIEKIIDSLLFLDLLV